MKESEEIRSKMLTLTNRINQLNDQYEKLEDQFGKALDKERTTEMNNIKNINGIDILLQFLQEKNISYWFDSWYVDSLFFRVYGDQYSIRHENTGNYKGFWFCCENYQDIDSLIEGITKKVKFD
jgi:hypothetical protein